MFGMNPLILPKWLEVRVFYDDKRAIIESADGGGAIPNLQLARK